MGSSSDPFVSQILSYCPSYAAFVPCVDCHPSSFGACDPRFLDQTSCAASFAACVAGRSSSFGAFAACGHCIHPFIHYLRILHHLVHHLLSLILILHSLMPWHVLPHHVYRHRLLKYSIANSKAGKKYANYNANPDCLRYHGVYSMPPLYTSTSQFSCLIIFSRIFQS
jgi:hypothetical protein